MEFFKDLKVEYKAGTKNNYSGRESKLENQ